jgi:hypothetical protein
MNQLKSLTKSNETYRTVKAYADINFHEQVLYRAIVLSDNSQLPLPVGLFI